MDLRRYWYTLSIGFVALSVLLAGVALTRSILTCGFPLLQICAYSLVYFSLGIVHLAGLKNVYKLFQRGRRVVNNSC